MNLFFVTKDNRLVTPELTGSILEGVTRSSVLALAKEMGLEPEERRIPIQEWKDGAASGEIVEIFACGTAAVITPVGELRWEGGVVRPPQRRRLRRGHPHHPRAAARHPVRPHRGHPRLADPPGLTWSSGAQPIPSRLRTAHQLDAASTARKVAFQSHRGTRVKVASTAGSEPAPGCDRTAARCFQAPTSRNAPVPSSTPPCQPGAAHHHRRAVIAVSPSITPAV